MNEIHLRILAPLFVLALAWYELFKNKKYSIGRKILTALLLFLGCWATIQLSIGDYRSGKKMEKNLEIASATIVSLHGSIDSLKSENKKLADELFEKTLVQNSPAIGIHWDSNYKYYAFYPVDMSAEKRSNKLKSKLKIINYDQDLANFEFRVSFSFDPLLYEKAFHNVPSTPLLSWTPSNEAKLLRKGDNYEVDIFRELRKADVNLAAIFPFKDDIYNTEKSKLKISTPEKLYTIRPFSENIDDQPPTVSGIPFKGLFFKVSISFSHKNIRYTHFATGRTVFGFAEPNSNTTKAMWVSDFFFKQGFIAVKSGTEQESVIKFPQLSYNAQQLIKNLGPGGSKPITLEAADYAGNWVKVVTWRKEINEKYYYNKYLRNN